MVKRENFMLSDRTVFPDEDHIFSLLGENHRFWQKLHKAISENFGDMSGNWHYYNDGKQWLYKLARKKKTIFWSALIDGTFRVTFYFGDKAEPLIMESDLPQEVKAGFSSIKKYGSLRPVSVLVGSDEDIDLILMLVGLKDRVNSGKLNLPGVEGR